jgi:hypothetical protein
MHNAKTKVIAAIIGTTGTIIHSFSKYLKNGEARKEMEETAILCTADILRKLLM